VVLSGSCSARTLEQVQELRSRGRPSFHLDAVATVSAEDLAQHALAWYDGLAPGPAPVIASSLPADKLGIVQQMLGVRQSAELLETAMGIIAIGLVDRGVRRLVVAGGETAGAVVGALGVRGGILGPEAAPGVPWIYSLGANPLALLLKSGNFGDSDLLVRASDERAGEDLGS
jgi:uncharacterized protein YgbK (DUF1537 family)